MAAKVKFTNNSIKVSKALESACIAYLYEAAGELEAQAKRNMPSGQWHAQIKNAWQYKVDESAKEAVIGNPLESSLWVEFGTGEFAIHGDGHKGYWVYVKDGDSGNMATYNGKSYSLAEAKRIVAMMRDDGIDAHYTKGQKAKKPLQNAFNSLKPALIRRAEQVLKSKMGD